MRKSWLALLVILATLVSSGTVAGQDALDSLINLALKNNPELAATSLMSQSASEDSRSSGSLPDPMISFGYLNLPVNSFALDRTPMSSVGLGISQKIPWPGKLSARSEASRLNFQRSETDVETTKNRLIREVTNIYLDYSYWKEAKTLINDFLQMLDIARNSAETRYANGKTSAQDILRVGTMYSRTQIRLLKADQKILAALLKIQELVGDTTIDRSLPAEIPQLPDGNSLPESVGNNPLLKNASLGIEQAQAMRRLAKRNYWPDLTFGINYNLRQKVPGDPVGGSDFMSFKVGFNIPLWFFAKQKHQVKSSALMLSASKEKERSIRDMLEARFEDAQSALELSSNSIHQYDDSVIPQAEAAQEAAQVSYEVGQVDFNAVLSAQSDLLEIRLERLDLLKQYNQSKAIINELAGVSNER